jgi:serine phosphatase RsbU (regulator of sigma subunit)/pSer/pThr/pTyr-binding forkhead associated (FHA) protein
MSSPRLHWNTPDGREQVFVISAPEVLIGRASDADIVVSNQHVSRRHAKVIAIGDGYQVVDCGTASGTFVNSERADKHVLRNGDKITLGTANIEFRYYTDAPQARRDAGKATSEQSPVDAGGRNLPTAASDLEKMLYVLDVQTQGFTPESGLVQILNSALKISGAERAFIMTRKGDGFGYAAGQDSKGKTLSESDFQASRTIVREVSTQGKDIFMVERLRGDYVAQESIVAMNLRAIACLPLRGIPTRGDAPEILGILYLDSTKAMHSLSGLDEKILRKLAVEAGNVLERVETLKSIEERKKLERDLALAEETQRSILPRNLPTLDHLKLHAFSKPTHYVGGDFYHFHVTDSNDLIGVLADVAGKGVAASLLSSMMLGCLQLLLTAGSRPNDALNRLNRFLHDKASGRFITLVLFSIGPNGSGEFISAGHNPVYVYRKSKKDLEELSSNNLVLGAFDFATFESQPLHLDNGDLLLVYSDGLTEAENPSGEMFGEERVKQVMRDHAADGAEKLHNAVLTAIQQFTQGHAQTDDITTVLVQRI